MKQHHPLDQYLIEGVEMAWLEAYDVVLAQHIDNVQIAGLHLGVPEQQLAMHDCTKFWPEEFPHYARQFCGDKGDPAGFAAAWLHHQNYNQHHHEYWVTRSDHSQGASGAVNGALPMPERYVREMIADWCGASKTYTGSWDIGGWFSNNVSRMNLHPTTLALLSDLLVEVKYGRFLEKYGKFLE